MFGASKSSISIVRFFFNLIWQFSSFREFVWPWPWREVTHHSENVLYHNCQMSSYKCRATWPLILFKLDFFFNIFDIFGFFKQLLWPWPWRKITYTHTFWKVLYQGTCIPSYKFLVLLLSEKTPMLKFITDRRTDVQMDGRTDGQTYGRTDGRMMEGQYIDSLSFIIIVMRDFGEMCTISSSFEPKTCNKSH